MKEERRLWEARKAGQEERVGLFQLEVLEECVGVLKNSELTSKMVSQGQFGPESTVLNSASHVPMEALAKIAKIPEAYPHLTPQIKKLMYSLTDGRAAVWRSNGTHKAGDIIWKLLGPSHEAIFVEAEAAQIAIIREDIAQRSGGSRYSSEIILSRNCMKRLREDPCRGRNWK